MKQLHIVMIKTQAIDFWHNALGKMFLSMGDMCIYLDISSRFLELRH